MNSPKCLRCGAGPEWIQGQVPDEPDRGVLACATALEKDMERELREVDAHLSKEEYGHANYCKGRADAFALASLRMFRLAKAKSKGQR